MFQKSLSGWRMLPRILASLLAGLALTQPLLAHADETEVFRADNENGNTRPKVLIIFDNSGSMGSLAQRKPAYNPAITYDPVPGIEDGRLYWASGNPVRPPPVNTSNWFPASVNRCVSSTTALDTAGLYTSSVFGMFRTVAGVSAWAPLASTTNSPIHVDCRADIDAGTNGNSGNGPGQAAGFPRTNSATGYGTPRDRDIDNSWQAARIYTANYMRWWYSATLQDRSRMDVAQGVISEIVKSNPDIDFGLATFNYNTSNTTDGGRIIRRIIENSTAAQQQNVVDMINQLAPGGNTPLCETLFEAYRYFSGGAVQFGLEKDTLNRDGPERDLLAERTVNVNYLSPAGDCQYVYVIFMTDGEPTSDTAADSAIRTLTGVTQCGTHGGVTSCMPELAEYMYNQDLDGVASNGIQRAVTYTIGFATNQQLLNVTAARGGGQYYTADNTEELTEAFQGAITSILSSNAAFTSPAVAVDSFTRTESRDDVFYAMFRPTTGVNWPGNIKKLKVRVAANGSAALVDSAGNEAIDSQTGFIKESAVTFWGSNPDGPAVSSGGVGARLAARDPDGRVIKTNTGTNGALQDFNITNINRDAYSLTTDAQLHSLFDAGSANELADLIAWARGWTDRNKTARRDWILGDIVHSRPLVLNYGARTSDFSASNPDLRVVVGTNAGFLHMFDTANGNENWAFFPKELTKIFKARKDDVLGGNKVWGVDAPVVSYRFDANQDGSIKAVDGDKMYIVFGLRRGGRALYAMDVTDPDNPSFLWRIGPDTAGFSELGQTWSVPVVTNVPGYVVGGVRRPVLVFGAGYDSVNDDITRTAAETVDTVGRGLFVVDVATGALVWSVTPAADSATNKREPGFVHAMAAPPSVIDSNGDGIADRVYMPDLGGNVWRIDMPGNTRPTAATEQNRWRVTKLASLANVALLNPVRQAGDRRFLSEVDVVRTTYQGKAFDAVLLGSGDRTNPKATDNVDRFYMLRDYQVAPYVNDAPTFLQCTALVNPSTDNRCRLPITESNLFDATDNTIQVGNVSERATARNSLATSMGWFVTLGSSLGEKSLSAATTLRGTTFFTTFAPNSATASTTICEPAAGTARLYALNLQDGSATIDFNGNGALVTADRSALLGSTVPDSPSLYFARDQQIRLLFPAGGGPAAGTRGAGGSNCGPGILCGPRGLRPVVPTYRYEQEY